MSKIVKLPPLPTKPKPVHAVAPNPRGMIDAAKAHGPKPRWPLATRAVPTAEAAE